MPGPDARYFNKKKKLFPGRAGNKTFCYKKASGDEPLRWFSLITSLIAAVFFLYMFLRGIAYSEIEEARAEKRATDSILNSESIPAPVKEENVPEGFFRVRGGAYNNISIPRGKIDGMLIGNAWTMTDKERISSFCYYCDIDTDIKLLVSYSRFQQYETNDADVKKRKKTVLPFVYLAGKIRLFLCGI